MKIVAVLSVVALAEGFSAHSSFVGGRPAFTSVSSASLRMDTEVDVNIDTRLRLNLEKIVKESTSTKLSISEAEAELGMPWKSSIDPKVKDEELLYMPFWEWQMSFMKENLTNLKVQPCSNGETDFSYNENAKKKARIVNLCASSDEYRKIRMTYYDAGDNTQVFNAVFYPDPKYNLPVLGVDLLAFNRKKYLAIVDFQPLHEDEADHASTFEHLLEPIKEKYDTLKGRMSSKFYDETQFFSQQMLFSRFEDEGIISRDLFPAFQSYVQTHLDLVRSTPENMEEREFVLSRQKEYDTYSAERDPAMGLFMAMFGAEWAQDYVHDFLFSMSERKEGAPQPMMFGGPPQGAPQGNPAARQPEAARR